MIIANCGYGCSGASAVFDFLRGYENIAYSPNGMEFDLIHQPDGLLDLKYHLCVNRERIACNTAIKRFSRMMRSGFWAMQMRNVLGTKFDELTQKYIDSLIQITWKGRSIFDPLDASNQSSSLFINKCYAKIETYLSKIKGKKVHFPPDQPRYLSLLSEEDFDLLTRKYIKELLALFNFGEKDIVLDMLFSVTTPNRGREFFDKVKTIVVTRDPRCMFLRANKNPHVNSYMPCRDEDIDGYIKYYRTLKKMEIIEKDVLYVNYDALVYEYTKTSQEIIDYLGYTRRPENEFKFFNPNVSVKYTYPENKQQNPKAVSIIEKELGEYLYDFPNSTQI